MTRCNDQYQMRYGTTSWLNADIGIRAATPRLVNREDGVSGRTREEVAEIDKGDLQATN